MADAVRVTNLGKEPITTQYDGKRYVLPCNEAVIVPAEVARKDFGDWDARNLGPGDMDRDYEYARIRGIYGVSEGARVPLVENGLPVRDKETGGIVEVLADEIVDARLPKVKIETLDGKTITGVLDDPKGTSLPLEEASQEDVTKVVSSLQQQMVEQQKIIDGLLAKQADVDIPVDSPENAPRPKTSKPKVSAARE